MVGPQKKDLGSFPQRNELGPVTLTIHLWQTRFPDPQ